MGTSKKNPYYSGPKSDHFDGTRFFMPGSGPAPGFLDLLKWQTNGQKAKWPTKLANRHFPIPPDRHLGDDFSVTYIGHATLLIQVCGLNILTDPFFSQRTSPVSFAGPKRARQPGIALQQLPVIDFILLSHNHFDHLDIASLKQLHEQFEPVIITPLGNGAIVATTKLDHHIAEADWGDTIPLNDSVKVTLTPAWHWSKRTANDRNMALWSAFVLQTPFGPIYFAGDTAFGDGSHFSAVAKEFGPPVLSMLPIGAYEPRWFMKDQHMNPDDAVKAHIALKSRQSLAYHHGTIQLTDEAFDAPLKDLATALDNNAVDPARFTVLDCGQSKLFK